MVASPSAFDPIAHPHAAKGRRNVVLKDMLQQGSISQLQYDQGINAPLPTAADIQQPSEPTAAPYFTSWLRPQILAAVGHGVSPSLAEYRAYYGGLKIKTTLDLDMQKAAEQAISSELPADSGLPSASLVAIDNKTGEVRAMVGGPVVNGEEDYAHFPFNLATEGHRQPGSAFKPFTLAEALKTGDYGPDSVITSAPQDFIVPNSAGKEHFIVHNFGNTYSGSLSLRDATAYSDNTVYSQVGIHVGTSRIKRLANAMGIRSPVSNNYAMILGGLREGVSPLDMAHAYETFATGGNRVYNPVLGAPNKGPTGISELQCYQVKCDGKTDITDHPDVQAHPPSRRGIGGARHPPRSGAVRHRDERTDLGRRRRGQDRHDLGLRGRLVRRLDAADDDRGLGRLPDEQQVDGHGLQRWPGRGRHLSGGHLAELYDPGVADHRQRGGEAPGQGQEERHGQQRQQRQQREHRTRLNRSRPERPGHQPERLDREHRWRGCGQHRRRRRRRCGRQHRRWRRWRCRQHRRRRRWRGRCRQHRRWRRRRWWRPAVVAAAAGAAVPAAAAAAAPESAAAELSAS